MISKLEKFSNDKNVNEIKRYLSITKDNFNIFKVLKLDNHEIRHSNFLAWLLNPKENHCLNNDFLQSFLMTAIQYNVKDSSDLIVETEYFTNEGRRIDILLHSKMSDFVCVIENKYGSNEHNEQCKHYKDFIENHSKFKDYKNKYYIFLDIEKPDKEQLQKALYCYEPMTYREIYKILAEILKNSGNLKQEVKQVIEQYKCIIMEKYSMVDETIKPKCREILREYHDVLDVMAEYKKTEFQTDVYNVMLSVLNDKNYVNADKEGVVEKGSPGYNNDTGCGVRFIPVKYKDNNKIKCPNDTCTEYILFFYFFYKKDKLTLSITDGKWKILDKKELDIVVMSDDEKKKIIIDTLNDLTNEYNRLVETL